MNPADFFSIKSVRAKFPPGLDSEPFGLLHEYYTPTILADAICPLLPSLAGRSADETPTGRAAIDNDETTAPNHHGCGSTACKARHEEDHA